MLETDSPTAINSAQPETSVPSPLAPQPKTNNSLLAGLIILVAFLLASTGYLAYQSYQLQGQLRNSQLAVVPSAQPVILPTAQPIAQPSSPSTTEPANSATNCGVIFPALPKGVDTNGRSWQIEEAKQTLFMFTDYVRAIHRSPSEASGYISGAIEVYCTANTENLNTADFNYQLDAYLIGEANGADAITMQSTKEVKMWGRDVREVTFTGGMFDQTKKYYLFTTPQRKYLISKTSMSTDSSVQKATESIFNNLKFEP